MLCLKQERKKFRPSVNVQKLGFYWDILLCIKEAVQLAHCVFRLTDLNSKSKSCACSMLPKAVSKPALHFQMDATRSHSTAVPCACHCGLVACLWHGLPGKKGVGLQPCYSGSQQQDCSCPSGVHLVTCGPPVLSRTMLPCKEQAADYPWLQHRT